MSEDNKEFITEPEAAKMLGYTPASLRARRFRKQSPVYYKVGGKVYYDLKDLKEFVQSGRVMPKEQGKNDD